MREPRAVDGEFQAEVVEEGGQPVVHVRGEIDVATAETFGAAIDEALARDPRVVIDLAEAPFMDSTGLSVLLRAYHATGRVKEGIVLRGTSAPVRRTLEISGLDGLITFDS